MADGGYDEGYSACPCFWGREPGSLIVRLDALIATYEGLNVLDAGCGEGKNSVYLAQRGANVTAFDLSERAISNAQKMWSNSHGIEWQLADVRTVLLMPATFDIVISYGLMHCLSNADEVKSTIHRLQCATKIRGYNVLCVFNNRHQDLSAHPNFNPCLLNHSSYLAMYEDWHILESSDTDLVETHPHNNIEHTHSMTRLIAQKV